VNRYVEGDRSDWSSFQLKNMKFRNHFFQIQC